MPTPSVQPVDLDDLDLLAERMKRADESAVGEFSRTMGIRLRGYFCKRGCSPADSEAFAVDCISQVWMGLDTFESRGPGSFKSWVFALARTIAINEYRRRRLPLVGLDLNCVPDMADDDDEARESDNGCVSADVEKALAELPEMHRELILLRQNKHLSFAEIAEVLGITEGAARVHYHRVKKRLAKRLAHLKPPPDHPPEP